LPNGLTFFVFSLVSANDILTVTGALLPPPTTQDTTSATTDASPAKVKEAKEKKEKKEKS
jgi:hypothetical protein